MRALIVDDSRAMRMMIGRMARALGAEVNEADNGQSALDWLEANGDVDIALVDWNMPIMNGLEFVKAVRAEPEKWRMTLMMVTTESEAEQVQRALEAGVDEYLMKPFTQDALAEKLEMLGLAVGA